MGMIKNDLLKLGIEMDVFTSEKQIISGHLLTEILKILESKNLIFNGVLDPPKGTDPKIGKKENNYYLSHLCMGMILIELLKNQMARGLILQQIWLII